MKKLVLSLMLVVAAGVGAYAYFKNGGADDKPRVNETAITEGTITQSVQATGSLEALRNVQVGSQVSGTVKAVYADFNSIVKKGQVIAELDSALLQIQVDVQKANLERQQGEIAQQQVLLANDQMNLDRAETLFSTSLVSEQQVETVRLTVKSRQASIESAKKQIVQARANLQQAELNVSYCIIRSPVDGVVVDRKVDIGQAVQASMTTPQFFTISTDLTKLKLAALVDESDIGFIRRGMPVTFTVDTYANQQFRGTVDAVRLNAQTANNVVTYPVWINVENADLKLRPSMTANLKIVIDQAVNVLRVPSQALRFRPTTDMYAWLGAPAPAAAVKGRGPAAGTSLPGTDVVRASRDASAGADRPVPITARNASQIDDLFAQVQKRVQPGQVWIYDETAGDPSKKLRAVSVRAGLTDGQFTELVSTGEPLPVGAKIVTGVASPASAAPKAAAGGSSIFNQNQRGGFGR
jgi:HlyD family secretion protein